MTSLIELEGISREELDKLTTVGIDSVESLLVRGNSEVKRRHLARATGLTTGKLLEWVNRADLMRIRAIRSQDQSLLRAAGVTTIAELALQNPSDLHRKLKDANDREHRVPKSPAVTTVRIWIDEARSIEAQPHTVRRQPGRFAGQIKMLEGFDDIPAEFGELVET